MTPEQFDAEFHKVNGSYGTTRERLRAAGERAKTAEAMRRAAIAEMGRAIRDHRTVLEGAAPEMRSNHRIQMDDAEELAGVSRRTLSEAARDGAERSDAEVAAEYRDYAYDLHYGGEELHRRYPRLAGLHDALLLLMEAESARWEAEHPDDPFGAPLALTEEQAVLRNEYERRVNAIAEGRTLR